MATFMRWLLHRKRMDDSSAVARTSRPPSDEEVGREPRIASSTACARTKTGLAQLCGGPVFVDLRALTQTQSALLAGLAPVSELAALVSFIGTGITAPHRYQDAAGAFNQLRLLAPNGDGVLIHLFRQKLRDESGGNDFIYAHFAGDPLSFGCLICALAGGGFMAGWRLG